MMSCLPGYFPNRSKIKKFSLTPDAQLPVNSMPWWMCGVVVDVFEEIERFSMYVALQEWCLVNGGWVYVVLIMVLPMY